MMARLMATFFAVSMLLPAPPASAETPQCPPNPGSLNNTYQGDDGGMYYISQFGTDVWWIGMSQGNRVAFANVFKGTLSGNRITGQWADTPLGKFHNHGDLTLTVNSNSFLSVLDASGGFTNKTWKVYAPCGYL